MPPGPGAQVVEGPSEMSVRNPIRNGSGMQVRRATWSAGSDVHGISAGGGPGRVIGLTRFLGRQGVVINGLPSAKMNAIIPLIYGTAL